MSDSPVLADNICDGEIVIRSAQLKTIEVHLIYVDALAKTLYRLSKEYGKSAIARKMDIIAQQLKISNDTAIKAVNGTMAQ
jgi:hypothetical protein